MNKAIEKENYNYNAQDKKCNTLDLELGYFKDFIDSKEGRSEHENYLLYMLEKEVDNLRDTIEAYKKELYNNHIEAIENLKK